MTRLHALVITCTLAVPSFGQQKTFNWMPGNDETVSLDPGYYHGGPTFQPSQGLPQTMMAPRSASK